MNKNHWKQDDNSKDDINNNIAYLRNKYGEIVDDPSKIPNILNEQYNSMFNNEVCYPHVVLNNSVPCNSNEIKLSEFFNRYDAPLTCVSLDVEKVGHAIDCIKSGSAPGPDSVSPLLLKMTKMAIAKFLADLMTQSFQNNDIPDILKLGTVIPRDKLEAKNYRPVSNLLFVSKLIERVVQTRLERHMIRNGLISNKNYAYMKNHSTEHLLLKVVNDLYLAFDENRPSVVVLLDLSAAFDTVDHDKLLHILEHDIGIVGITLKWFESFLKGRNQKVKIGEVTHIS